MEKPLELRKLPTFKGIRPPEGGWKERTYYQVWLAVKDCNPVWEGVLAVGFLHSNGTPGAYSKVCSISTSGDISMGHIYAMEVKKELFTETGALHDQG